jgi:hypothetical protein
MLNSYTTQPHRVAEDDSGASLASTAPRPFTLAGHESINPIPKLLLSFPVPRMVSQMHLETAWSIEDEGNADAADSAAATAAQRGGWSAEEVGGVVQGMQRSAQYLLRTGSCGHFLQEQLHHEVATPHHPASEGVGEGSRVAIPSEVAGHVSAAVAPGITKLLDTLGQQSTVLEVPLARNNQGEPPKSTATPMPNEATAHQRVPLTLVPKTEMWTKREESSVSLRQRHSIGLGGAWADASSESLDSSTGAVAAADGGTGVISAADTRCGCAAVSASSNAASLPSITNYEPRVGADVASLVALMSTVLHTGNDASASFAQWVRQQQSANPVEVPVAQLLHFISALPLQLHPFEEIEREQLSSFLSSLLADDDETAKDRDKVQWSMRGLLCCQCLAHPHFPTEAVTDGLVRHTIDAFGSVVRDVSSHLQTEQQQRSASASVAGGGHYGEEKERQRLSAASKHGGGTGGCTTSPADVSGFIPALEQLRGFLGGFARILCNSHLRLVMDTDVLRLEELCHQCLFRLTRACTKELHVLYSTYVVDSAVHLYRCIWNCLDVQRQHISENFFQQLPLCESLMQRTYQTHLDGCAVLPLTVAMLAAAQSTPLPLDAIGAATAEALQRQCGLWANGLVQTLLLNAGGEREKAEDALAWAAAIRVAEDLVDLLSVPEWPGADLLLRSLVLSLAQLTLGSEEALSAPAEVLRPLAVDVLGHVAVKLFDAQHFPVASAIQAEMERLGDSTSTSQAAARLALQRVLQSTPPLHAEEQEAWERLCGGRAVGINSEGGAEPDRHPLDLIAAVYMAESQLITSPSTAADYAAVWFHVRAARLMTWVCLQDSSYSSSADADWIPPGSLDALVRWEKPPGSSGCNPSINWGSVCAWTQAIRTQAGKSMLSLRMRHTLVSMLFSVFHLRDAQGATVTVTEVVQKKTLGHLARLTTLHPPLHRYLWPIVRQCVRDDSARVRESIVPLLLTLLSDAVKAETNADCPTVGHLPTLTTEGIAAGLISSLLYLLGDKSVSVVSRTITALDAFLTDPNYLCIFAAPQGASLLSFIQLKLLSFVSPTAEPKHRQEVVKHFLHRWAVTLAESDDSLTGAHAQLAKELVALAVMGAPEFPFDVTDEHPLVQVLQQVHVFVLAHDPSAETSQQKRGAAAVSHPKRRSRGYHVDAGQLLHVMRCAAQSLWMRYQCFHSSDDAVACLATLRALTLARGEWVMPLAEVLVQSLTYPPPTTSPLGSAPEALGGSLLQLCLVLHDILQAPKLPLISLDYLARCLTTLLSKYVGPLQQRVIVASCGALCTLITCGAKHRLSARVNVPYLQLCYSLMNTYYCRVRALLPTLGTQPQSVAYTQRFLFLLSELLRDYPGWKVHPPHPALLGDTVGGSNPSGGAAQASGSPTAPPNQLSKGPGIAANMYQLLEDVLQSCGNSHTRERLAVIVLRVVASLCMLDPTTYFHRAEAQIRAALTSPDHSLQLQGLSLLSDFLKEEDARVDAASRSVTRLDTTALILGTHESTSPSRSRSQSNEDQRTTKGLTKAAEKGTSASSRPRCGKRAKQARLDITSVASPSSTPKALAKTKQIVSVEAADGATEDFNSGMSTWIFQQFHADIVRLSCRSAHVAVRSLCLRLFQQAAQGGLLPPDKYVRVLIALAADVHAPLRQQAIASLAIHCDRHEEVVAASVGRGVVLAFDLHHACGAHLLRSAVVPAPSFSGPAAAVPSGWIGGSTGGEQSVHGALYGLLHKRFRDNMITTVVRFFYQDGKVLHWCEEHAAEVVAWSSPQTTAGSVASAAPAVGFFGVLHPLLFLCHLTLMLFTLPFQHENDVLHLMQQCRVALDLNGQSALDWLRESSVDVIAGGSGGAVVSRWKAIGALLLYYLRRALLSEYRLTSSKVQRYRAREKRPAATSSGHNAGLLRRRDSAAVEGGTAAVSTLINRLQTLVEKMEPVLASPSVAKTSAAYAAAWRHVISELEDGLLHETVEEAGGVGASTARTHESRQKRVGVQKRGTTERPKSFQRSKTRVTAAAKRRRDSSISSEDTLSATDESYEEESMSPTTASRGDSTVRSTPTTSLSSSPATSHSRASATSVDDDNSGSA